MSPRPKVSSGAVAAQNQLRHGILLDAYRLLPHAWLSWLRKIEQSNRSSSTLWESPVELGKELEKAATMACVHACCVLNYDQKNADGPSLEEHWKALLPVLIQVSHDEPLAENLAAAGVRLVGLGQVEEALRCFHDACQVTPAEGALGGNLLTNIMRVLLGVGDREHLARQLRSYKSAPGVCPTTVGLALLETGSALEAKEALQEALTYDIASLGPSHPEVAVDLANLAAAHFRLDEFGAARDCLQRSLAIARQEIAPDDSRRLTIEKLWAEVEEAAPAN